MEGLPVWCLEAVACPAQPQQVAKSHAFDVVVHMGGIFMLKSNIICFNCRPGRHAVGFCANKKWTRRECTRLFTSHIKFIFSYHEHSNGRCVQSTYK